MLLQCIYVFGRKCVFKERIEFFPKGMEEVLYRESQYKFRFLNHFLISEGIRKNRWYYDESELVEVALYPILIHHRIEFKLKDEGHTRLLFCLSCRHFICHERDWLLKIKIIKLMKWKLEGWPPFLGTSNPAKMSSFISKKFWNSCDIFEITC